MQDMEFVIYTEVVPARAPPPGQRRPGRQRPVHAAVGVACRSAESPWTRSLTDDLDLGVRLHRRGLAYGLLPDGRRASAGRRGLRRLIRQRSRWFQGHLQSWTADPARLAQYPAPGPRDLLYHLSSPAVLLIASLLSASFILSLAN